MRSRKGPSYNKSLTSRPVRNLASIFDLNRLRVVRVSKRSK